MCRMSVPKIASKTYKDAERMSTTSEVEENERVVAGRLKRDEIDLCQDSAVVRNNADYVSDWIHDH